MIKYFVKTFYYTKFFLFFIIFLVNFFILDEKTAFAVNEKNRDNYLRNKKFRVTEVHDGDTVSIRISGPLGLPVRTERIRLIGVDAPELKQEPWGRISKRFLKRIISQSDWIVFVEFDIEQRDKYGRLLAYLWTKKGEMINEMMVLNGYAILYTIPPNVKYVDRLVSAQRHAQMKKLGIWGKKGLRETPQQWRKAHPEN